VVRIRGGVKKSVFGQAFFVVIPYPAMNYQKPAQTIYSETSRFFVGIGLGQQKGQQSVVRRNGEYGYYGWEVPPL
jgi:hypothetical protein